MTRPTKGKEVMSGQCDVVNEGGGDGLERPQRDKQGGPRR